MTEDLLRTPHFASARDSAAKTAADPEKVASLLDEMTRKADRWAERRGAFRRIFGQFQALARMVRAYYRGEYHDVPWETILIAIAALTYFVMPMDALPDFLVGLGYLDDAALLSFVIAGIRMDLEKFLRWERTRQPPA